MTVFRNSTGELPKLVVSFGTETLKDAAPRDGPERSPHYPPAHDDRGDAQRQATQHQRKNDNVPRGPMIVQPREIHRMQAVIKPARHERRVVGMLSHNAAGSLVDIELR